MDNFFADTADAYAAALADPSSAARGPGLSEVSARMIAQVERELADLKAADLADADADADAEKAAPRARAARQGNGSSVVFTVRLDPRELDALQRRAAVQGVRPSVLARNLIRIGVQPKRRSGELGSAVERLEAALAPIEAALAPMEAALAPIEAALAPIEAALAAVRAALPAH